MYLVNYYQNWPYLEVQMSGTRTNTTFIRSGLQHRIENKHKISPRNLRFRIQNGITWYLQVLILFQATHSTIAACLTSDLPKGVTIVGACGFQQDDICNAACMAKETVLWKEKTRCVSHGHWSDLPTCQLEQESTALELVRCDHLPEDGGDAPMCVNIKLFVSAASPPPKTICPGILKLVVQSGTCDAISGTDCAVRCGDGSYVLLCLFDGQWSPSCAGQHRKLCPELKFAELVNCSRALGTSCKVRCPNGKIPIQETACLPTGEWSPLPSCYYRSLCANEELPPEIDFLNKSCKSSIATSCKVGCSLRVLLPRLHPDSHKLIFIKKINCSPAGSWRGLPDCKLAKQFYLKDSIKTSHCPNPIVGRNAVLQGNCSTDNGQMCHYKCKTGFFPNKTISIRCSQKKWVGIVQCHPLLCPPLPNALHFQRNCSRLVGSKCHVLCRKGKLIGNSNVVCHSSRNWSRLPHCGITPPKNKSSLCPRKISSYITFVDRCTFKNGDKCQIRCKAQLVLVGVNFVRCQNSSWKNVPQCFPERVSPYRHLRMRCRFPPRLYGNLKIRGLCMSSGGLSCEIACRDPSAKMMGPNATTCLPPGLWSKIKPCNGGVKYCPEPILKKGLETREDCTGKEVGSQCRIQCKHRPIINFDINCMKDEKWSTPKKCYCANPILEKGMDFEENCTTKTIGAMCRITCKLGYSNNAGDNYITCQDNLRWSKLPSCRKVHCQKPNLTKSLIFREDCTSKTFGEHCSLECREGGNISKPGIKCIDGIHWTDLPICSCPVPFLSEDLKTNGDCINKSPGEKCFLSCLGKLKMIGRNYIQCQSTSKWTNLPKCKKNVCPKLRLPTFLIYAEDCSSKQPGEQCRLECKEHGKIIGSAAVTCLKGTRWTALPTCTCPQPLLPEYLEVKQNCESKSVGEHCLISCKKNLKLEGNNSILCLNNTQWSKSPKCVSKICTKVSLPKSLIYAEDCSTVTSGGKCRLECREGGNFIGRNFMTCINGSKWTHFPNCTCPPPILPDDLTAEGKCDSIAKGGICSLKCKRSLSLIGNNFIQCQNITRWSQFPSCKKYTCLKLDLPKILEYSEDCSSKQPGQHCRLQCKEGGKLIGPKTIRCVNGTKWTSFPNCTCPTPVLNRHLVFSKNCSSKKIGEKCHLICKRGLIANGLNFITCNIDTRWTNLPSCKAIFCPKPKLTNEITSPDCSSKKPGESCLLECREGGQIIGTNKITCINGTRWSAFPNCTCPIPVLTDSLTSRENCSSKKIEEKCALSCKKHHSFVSKDFIVCQKNTRWSDLPKCRKLICPKPKLSTVLDFREDCHSKGIGEKCNLECKEGGKFIGSESIICLHVSSKLKWSSLPHCTCPPPILPEDLKVAENCQAKKPDETCKLICRKKLSLIGKNSIICQDNTRWSLLPKCQKFICPMPKLNEELLFQEDCSSKTFGESCILECRTGGKLLATNKISCLNSTHWTSQPKCPCPPPTLSKDLKFMENCSIKHSGEVCRVKCKEGLIMKHNHKLICQSNLLWSSAPECKKRMCSKPALSSNLLFDEDCTTKKPYETCKLTCKLGGSVVGNSSIMCTKEGMWTALPECACPEPYLHVDLEANETCGSKLPGDICFLKCKENLTLIGNSYITCTNNTEWTAQPICEKRTCPTLKLPPYLKFLETCSSELVSSKCIVGCKNGGNLIGSHFIQCLNTTLWSDFPVCTCPEPKLTAGLQATSNCSHKRTGQKCYLRCAKRLKLIGKTFIQCLRNSKWSIKPRCLENACPKPRLTDSLMFDEDCQHKIPGEKCKLKCKQGGQSLELNEIKCLRNKQWSSLPVCTCPLPALRDDLKTTENCSLKTPGKKCHLACKNSNTHISEPFITCQNNTMWNNQPTCEDIICRKPKLPDTLMFKDNCSFKLVGDSCELSCRNGGNLIGLEAIKCISLTEWSEFPLCTCPIPVLSDCLSTNGDCSNVLPGGTCKLLWKPSFSIIGKHFIQCLNTTKWSRQPKCKKQCCRKPHLPPYLMLDSTCSSKDLRKPCEFIAVGETCKVTCRHGGKISRDDPIKCITADKWSPFPDCSCPVPTLKPPFDATRYCGYKRRGEKCELGCQTGFHIKGNASIECKETAEWSTFPTCVKVTCPPPDINKAILKINGNCVNKAIGDVCHVSCKESGKLLGGSSIECLSGRRWSSFPDCTCPYPYLRPQLKIKGNCDSVKRGEKCFLECKSNLELKGQNFITCQSNTKWTAPPTCGRKLCRAPDLTDGTLSTAENCSVKYLGDTCKLRCTYGGKILGNHAIKCLNTGKWSRLPECTCAQPKVTADIIMKENCASKRRNDKCSFRCKTGYVVKDRNFITCQNDTKWSPLTTCVKEACNEPSLRAFLTLEGKCTNKSFGDKCRVSCKEGGKLIGKNTIECLSGNKWSAFPKCTCPTPSVKGDIIITEDCASKTANQKCKLGCKAGSYMSKGINYIFCQEDTKWSPISAKCIKEYCSKPSLSGEFLKLEEDCSNKSLEQTCLLSCKNGGKLLGKNTIRCLSGNKWSSLPDCTCPTPIVTAGLKTKGSCDAIKRTAKCFLECEPNLILQGSNFIICQNNATWSPISTCVKEACKEPSLRAFLTLEGKCTNKLLGDTCRVSCKEGGKVIGKNTIECLSGNRWSDFPKCTCPTPSVKGDLIITEDCASKTANQKCKLGCKAGSYMSKGINYIICQEDTKWSPISAKCVKEYCSKPSLHGEFLKLEEDCSNKSLEQTCLLSCKNGGKLLGKNTIRCLSGNKWSSLPDCTCPTPIVTAGLKTKSSCVAIKRTAKCFLECEPNLILQGSNFIMCQNNATWSPLPKCSSSKFCPIPQLPRGILTLVGRCRNKSPGEKCAVRCLQGGMVIPRVQDPTIRRDEIKCLEGMMWSAFPDCACAPPRVPEEVILLDNCQVKGRNNTCPIGCKTGYSLQGPGHIICQNDTKWSTVPDCVKWSCPEPVFSSVLALEGDCVGKHYDDVCLVRCKEGGKVIGSNTIKCLDSRRWSEFPTCTCPVPVLSIGLATVGKCDSAKPGDKCFLKCQTGYLPKEGDYIICNQNTTWSSSPSCVTA